jgi:hypothetical protein
MQYVHGINHNVAECPQGSTQKERREEKRGEVLGQMISMRGLEMRDSRK